MKRSICFVLALILVFAPLFSCGSDTSDITSDAGGGTTDNGGTDSSAESSGGFDDRLSVDDRIGAYDFKDANFDIVLSTEQMSDPYFTDTENGEIINDAVYKRTIDIEDRFKVKFNHHDTGRSGSYKRACGRPLV